MKIVISCVIASITESISNARNEQKETSAGSRNEESDVPFYLQSFVKSKSEMETEQRD